MWGVCTHICSNKLERVALLSLVELSTRLAAPRANSQAVGLWGFGFVQGVGGFKVCRVCSSGTRVWGWARCDKSGSHSDSASLHNMS